MLANKLVLRPLIGLMHGLPQDEIEWFVLAELQKHRSLREEAVRLEGILDDSREGESRPDINRAYISAMIAVHAQQTVVSTLVDILGYVPEMQPTTSH